MGFQWTGLNLVLAQPEICRQTTNQASNNSNISYPSKTLKRPHPAPVTATPVTLTQLHPVQLSQLGNSVGPTAVAACISCSDSKDGPSSWGSPESLQLPAWWLNFCENGLLASHSRS